MQGSFQQQHVLELIVKPLMTAFKSPLRDVNDINIVG